MLRNWRPSAGFRTAPTRAILAVPCRKPLPAACSERRRHNYLKLQRELAALVCRSDAAAQRAYQREWHQKVVSAGKSQRWAERETAERKDRSGRKRRYGDGSP